jgi:hypothetical protein
MAGREVSHTARVHSPRDYTRLLAGGAHSPVQLARVHGVHAAAHKAPQRLAHKAPRTGRDRARNGGWIASWRSVGVDWGGEAPAGAPRCGGGPDRSGSRGGRGCWSSRRPPTGSPAACRRSCPGRAGDQKVRGKVRRERTERLDIRTASDWQSRSLPTKLLWRGEARGAGRGRSVGRVGWVMRGLSLGSRKALESRLKCGSAADDTSVWRRVPECVMLRAAAAAAPGTWRHFL